ncbi:MAG TPA: diaminopimelate decarboxylase [Solirubrobacteraceae bacterium]|nr:diaminopimelate decarboxylase [Solirubrobacteraceae bacterium]
MATGTTLSDVFPLDSRVNERGRLEVGGCDAIELASEFGTPAYVVAEDDLRARARAFIAAGRATGHGDFHVAFASKAFPCTAVLATFAQEGLWCDVASGGELHLALNGGFPPDRLVVHGNAKSEAELRMALRHRVGLLVVDNFDELERLERLLAEGAGADREQPVLVRVTPDVRGETNAKISTGQADSKFGFAIGEAARAFERVRAVAGLELRGVHAHIGSQLVALDPFRAAVAELAALGEFEVWDFGGGLGVRYTAEQAPVPTIEEYVGAVVGAAHANGIGAGRRVLIEPGRALCANAGLTLYRVENVRRNVSRWVAVDGGMSDNIRPMLYGAAIEAHVADRFDGSQPCVLAGKHCESGDVLVREARLDDPRAGDVIVTPATGAYGFAMASNYNGVPRPPVIFCRDGDARVVVRRESFEDLTARDVA